MAGRARILYTVRSNMVRLSETGVRVPFFKLLQLLVIYVISTDKFPGLRQIMSGLVSNLAVF